MIVKKRFLPTLIAFLVLAILLVYANYYEIDEILPPGVQKPLSILNCSSSDIVALNWRPGSEDELKVVFNASGSRIIAPGEFRTDGSEAEGLLKHFSELRAELVIAENATDTTVYGIDADSPVVTVETSTQSTQLSLGSKTQVGGSFYLVKKGDSRVFMVPGYISGSFAKTLDDLRDRQFFNEDFGQVVTIKLIADGKVIELKQSESLTEWRIEAPVSLPADGVAVAQMLQNLRNLRVSRFVEDHPTDADGYGFKSPNLKIVATNKDGREFFAEIGEMSGVDTYVRTGGSEAIHAAKTSSINDLRLNLNDLREKHLAVPLMEDATEVTVADASGAITLEKKENGWMVGVEKIAEADVRDFFNSLGRSRVNSFQPQENLDEYGLKDREKCRTVELKGKTAKLMLWLGNRKGASLSLLTENELVDISAELDDAFITFMGRLRRPPEDVKNVMGGNEIATSAIDLETP